MSCAASRPPLVQKEIAVYLLTYNLVRRVMAQAAQLAGQSARQAGHQRQCAASAQGALAQALLESIARCLLPKRPGRLEPRAKKRRPKPLPLLRVPREVAREQIRALRA